MMIYENMTSKQIGYRNGKTGESHQPEEGLQVTVRKR